MALHVRLRDAGALRERLDQIGDRHADLAFQAGLTPSRLSQILNGIAPAVPIDQAARLEYVLGVELGTFFEVDGDSRLVRAYLEAGSGAA